MTFDKEFANTLKPEINEGSIYALQQVILEQGEQIKLLWKEIRHIKEKVKI